MPPKLIRYRVKPEKIEENQRLIEDVFRELHAKSPKDARYLVLKLSDGTFCHLFEDTTKTIPNLDAFAAFRRGSLHALREKAGGRYRDRTCGPCRVKAVLYR